MDIKITAKDFGPLYKADPVLKPLTIFIGPNNSGKSYLSILTYSIHKILEGYLRYLEYFSTLTHISPENERKWLQDVIKQSDEDKFIDVPPEIIREILQNIFELLFGVVLKDEIEKSFASPIDQLVRIGKKSFSVSLKFSFCEVRLRSRKDKLSIENLIPGKIGIKINPLKEIQFARNRILGKKSSDKSTRLSEEEINIFAIKKIHKKIIKNIFDSITKGSGGEIYYLPSAKSGILLHHKLLLANITEELPFMGMRGGNTPVFTGVIADFLSNIIKLPDIPRELYELATEFEEKITRGNIILSGSDNIRFPDIRYKLKNTQIPLYRTSSTVTELASFFLFLKYLINPGDLLVIEEPEAHLHPENQRLMAQLLVRLVRNGVKILITTHSEFLLEQLSNFIMMSKVEPEARVKKYDLSEDDYLTPDEVSVNVFRYDKRSGAFKTKMIKTDEEDGISEDEFMEVTESLYNQMVKIQRAVNDEEKKKEEN
ncbi:MAG: AAA family ATPase [Candidatus Eremiobacteraeota bacterium]|nr:AAA family ATPase [Candidatus Eremiobacteraeota bacterium]